MEYNKFYEKFRQKFPNEEYEIIQAGEKSWNLSIIKCLKCGKIYKIKNGDLLARTRTLQICHKCYPTVRKDTLSNRALVTEALLGKGEDIEFFSKKQSEKGNYGDAVRFKCKECGQINERIINNLVKDKTNVICNCIYCSAGHYGKNTQEFQKELDELYPKHFIVLEQYKNVRTRIKVKCNFCGSIIEVIPVNLIRNGRCINCEGSLSKGEIKIISWLERNNLKFELHKYFKDWGIELHYYDFYIPSYNLVIEFHGRQHYEYVEFFHHNEDEFKYRINKDKIKKEEALKRGMNYLSIKYTLLDSIDKILDKILLNSTTISVESIGKCLEIETIRQLDEDIV